MQSPSEVVNNADTDNCEVCDVKFSRIALRFKYNCTSCGKCICAKCHNKSVVELEDGEFEWYRECKSCHTLNVEILQNRQKAEEEEDKKKERGIPRGQEVDLSNVVVNGDSIAHARQIVARSD